MTLAMRRVVEPGNIARERLMIRAVADVDVGKYVLCRARSDGDLVFAEVDHCLWLPDQRVSRGDLVVVYTKAGTAKEKPAADGRTTNYFFYWDLSAPIWGSENHSAVLMHVDTWTSLRPKSSD
jgi:hypothetical protein